jgi:bifunctional UDP-N-acetylglucosamine pyrophosphorylase / glucosamine-1-phosphate N-acetyltransferase
VIDAARVAGAEPLVVVTSPDARDAFDTIVAVQEEPRGTGDAVRAARAELDGFDGDVLVLNGDVPGLTADLLRELLATHRSEAAAATVLSFEPPDVREYGRIVRDENGHLAAIVEAGDASTDELALTEVNSGIYVFRAAKLWPALERLEPHNVQGELYLTDTLGFLVADGDPVAVHVAPVRLPARQHADRRRRRDPLPHGGGGRCDR